MCKEINEERAINRLSSLKCVETANTLAWNRVEQMSNEEGIKNDGADIRLKEWHAKKLKADKAYQSVDGLTKDDSR
jgi:hypothetical protein